MCKYYIIYETKNLKNGKIYIGMHETDNLEDGYLGSGKRLKRAIRYYGREFFEKRILHVFDNREDMVTKEIELVTEDFVNREDTYNLTTGGEGGLISKEQQKIRSEAGGKAFRDKLENDLIFRKQHIKRQSDRFKEMHKNGEISPCDWTGKKHSEESKAKMRESHKGKQSGSKNSQYGSRWITNKVESRKIGKDEPIPEGWFLGRKIK